jgi:hypothetical protein
VSSVNLVKDATVMSDLDTAEAFQQEFASNFSTYTSAVSNQHTASTLPAEAQLLLLNSSESLVAHAINSQLQQQS